MKENDSLGEFEHVVLLAVLRLGDAAYGVTVRDELSRRTGREPARGALYVTLDRLESKGYLESRFGSGEPGRGGRPRRYFSLTTEGLATLDRTRRTFLALWQGIEWPTEPA